MSPLTVILLSCAVGILFYGRSRQRASRPGGLWTGIGAGLLLAGVLSLLLHGSGSEADREMAASVRRGEARGHAVGHYLAQHHAGARALVLRPPENYPGPRHPDMLSGLQQACGTDVELVDIQPLTIPPRMAEALADPTQSAQSQLGLEAWIRLDEIERLVEEYADRIDLVILALDHPYNLAGSDWLRDPDAPRAVLLHYVLEGLGPAIADGRICAAVAIAPSAAQTPPASSSLRTDVQSVFDQHYLLVTPGNAANLAEAYPQLF